MRKAFITGVTGQDGSYLAEFLLEKGYEVHGLVRRHSDFTTNRINSILHNERFFIHYGDLSDASNIYNTLSLVRPDEIYNLGAQSHVGLSFSIPEYSSNIDGLGVLRLLSAVRDLKLESKFYQASTSELFGGMPGTAPQNELTAFNPRSPYATAKLYAYWVTRNFRESYGMFACNGILFNHESPRRGRTFVTKKVTRFVADIIHGKEDVLRIGNLDARRDWGYAKEYVESMWLMLQQKAPDDYVIGTGYMYSVREFIEKSFSYVGINIEWQGENDTEIGIDTQTKKMLIRVDPYFYRPAEVQELCADDKKAREILNWAPKTNLDDLIGIMINYDLKYSEYGHPED